MTLCFFIVHKTRNPQSVVGGYDFVPLEVKLRLLFLLFTSLLFSFFSSGVNSAPSISTQVSESSIYLGEEYEIHLKVKDMDRNSELIFPKVKHLKFRQLGSPDMTSQTTIINGNVKHFSGLVYRIGVQSEKEGRFTIPGIQVKWKGKIFQGKQFLLEFIKTDSQNQIITKVLLSKQTIFLNQPVEITLQWYLRVGLQDYLLKFPLLEQKEALHLRIKEETASGEIKKLKIQRFQVPFLLKETKLEGEKYTLYEVSFEIRPAQTGTLTIPPFTAIGKIKQGQKIIKDPFWGRRRVDTFKKIVTKSKHLELKVVDLPLRGRPKSFTGGVGLFNFVVQATPKIVKVGDPIEVTLSLSGKGNFNDIELPKLFLARNFSQDFGTNETLQPIENDDTRAIFRVTLRAKHAQVKQIPAIPFSYFALAENQYKTINSLPVDLEVKPSKKVKESDIYVPPEQKVATLSLLYNPTQIRANHPVSHVPQVFNSYTPWSIWIVFFPLNFYLIRFVSKNRISFFILFEGGKNGIYKRHLNKAEELLSNEDIRFYDEIYLFLQVFLQSKLNLGTGSLTEKDVLEFTNQQKISSDKAKQLIRFFETCDHYRFMDLPPKIDEKKFLLDQVKDWKKSW